MSHTQGDVEIEREFFLVVLGKREKVNLPGLSRSLVVFVCSLSLFLSMPLHPALRLQGDLLY